MVNRGRNETTKLRQDSIELAAGNGNVEGRESIVVVETVPTDVQSEGWGICQKSQYALNECIHMQNRDGPRTKF